MLFTNLPDEVLIIHPAKVLDEYGNPSLTFNDDTAIDPTRGWLQREQGTGGESVSVGRNSSASIFRLFLPAGTEISSRDQVQVEGITYTVDGEPVVARGLRGNSHVKARLRRLEG
jgi:hypothetical protein